MSHCEYKSLFSLLLTWLSPFDQVFQDHPAQRQEGSFAKDGLFYYWPDILGHNLGTLPLFQLLESTVDPLEPGQGEVTVLPVQRQNQGVQGILTQRL